MFLHLPLACVWLWVLLDLGCLHRRLHLEAFHGWVAKIHHCKMKEDGKMAKDVLQDVLVKQGLVFLEQPEEEEEEARIFVKSLRHKEAPVLDAPALRRKN